MNLKEAVIEVIERKPCIRSALYEGLMNYSALASYLKDEVENLVKRRVSEASVMMALRDLRVYPSQSHNLREALLESYYSIDSGLKDYVVDWSIENITKLFHKLAREGIVITLIVGKNYASILTHENIEDYLREIGMKPLFKRDNLSNFRVVIKEKYVDSVGIIDTILRGFVMNNISVIETASSFTEIGFIIKEEDVTSAVLSYNRLIKRLKEKE